jgi:ribosome recycling factor
MNTMSSTSLVGLVLVLACSTTTTTTTTAFVTTPALLLRNRQHVCTNTALFASEEMDLITMDADERMAKSVTSVKQNLQTIRTGRANANMLDRVQVDYYGVMTPINQMASIGAPSSQQLSIDPFDKSTLSAIERALVESDLGMTPSNDGNKIRLNIPQLTEERRREMMKLCKGIGEDGKVAVRNIRRDGVEEIKKLEKAKEIGEDEAKDGFETMQKMTDKTVKLIDEIVAKKEIEVMTV